MNWLRAISRFKGTQSCAPNFAYDLCVRKIAPEDRRQLDLQTWSVAVNAAEPVRRDTLNRFAEAFGPCGFRKEAFAPAYGLAEGTLMVSMVSLSEPPVCETFDAALLEQKRVQKTPPSESIAYTLVGCGPAGLGQQIAIVHAETKTRCQPDEAGEIWVKGPSVAQGYWRRTLETEQM